MSFDRGARRRRCRRPSTARTSAAAATAPQRAAGAVAPAALDADLLHQPRAEHAAEHRLGDRERRGVRSAVACGQVADPDLRLRAIGLVDEDQPASGLGREVADGGGGGRGAGGQARGQARDQLVGGLRVDVAGDADDEVVGDDLAAPQRDRGGALDRADRRRRAERGAATYYAWPGLHTQSNQRVASAPSSSRISSSTCGVSRSRRACSSSSKRGAARMSPATSTSASR